MPLLRFARPCPCGFIRNRTMPLPCETSPGLASAGLCRVSPCSTVPLRCYDLHCLCCAYESPTLFCHRRVQRNSAMPLLCLEMPPPCFAYAEQNPVSTCLAIVSHCGAPLCPRIVLFASPCRCCSALFHAPPVPHVLRLASPTQHLANSSLPLLSPTKHSGAKPLPIRCPRCQ